MRRMGAAAMFAIAVAGGDPSFVAAQPAAPLSTLSTWADGVWLSVLDRDGAWWGRIATQGVFQRFNPVMHTDYELNVALGRFSPAEDARWAGVTRGLRGAGASLSHPHLLNLIEWRERVPIAGSVGLVANYVRERSLTAQRDYVRMGVRWGNTLGSGWDTGLEFGVHFSKPSADVELVAARRWESGERATSVEFRGAVLDAFSNVVFNELGARAEEEPTQLDYASQPLGARVALVSATPSWRFEVHAGASNRTRAAVSFPASDVTPFDLTESAAFGGVLAEHHPTGGLTLAAYGAAARAESDRQSTEAGADLRVRETTRLAGGRARYALREPLVAEVDARTLWRPESREGGGGPNVNHEDSETLVVSGVARTPEAGWTWRLALMWSDRAAGDLMPGLTAAHRRHLMDGGYRFASGFDVNVGLRWNIDDLSTVLFAGGHVRFTASW